MRMRRHGAGRDTADIGMMAAACHPENNFSCGKHRRHNRNIRKMRTARSRMIGQQYITGPDIRATFDLLADRLAHGAEMHRHMGGVGHQVAGRIKQGTGKIKPLLDIGGDGCFLQHPAHLFGNGHEEIGKNRQLDGIDRCSHAPVPAPANTDLHIAILGDQGRTIGLDHNGCRLLDDDGRTRQPMPSRQLFHQIQARVPVAAPKIAGNHPFLFRLPVGTGNFMPGKTAPPADGANAIIINKYLPFIQDKAKLPPITGRKGLGKTVFIRLFDHQGGIRSPVTQIEISPAHDFPQSCALPDQLYLSCLLQFIQPS